MLRVESLVKEYRDKSRRNADHVRAVDGVSLVVERGALHTLLGPSGCGKTTTLRCIAGLENPDRGEISLDGRVLFSSSRRKHVSANARSIGMVFQSYAIWPHMTVFANVAFPLEVSRRRRALSRGDVASKVAKVLNVVGLGDLAQRDATNLSGGQQQRIALARALVMESPLLLLDEPLSNLDAALREEMRGELKAMQRAFGVTTVYVTHDQAEALSMSDRVTVMRSGKVEQVGTPHEIYRQPASRFVARFVGRSNILEGVIERSCGDSSYAVETAVGRVVGTSVNARFTQGQRVVVIVRPEDIRLAADDGSELGAGVANCLHGTLRSQLFLGDAEDAVADVLGVDIKVRSDARSPHSGTSGKVSMAFDQKACLVLSE